jgi:ferredoxin-NADP reductase
MLTNYKTQLKEKKQLTNEDIYFHFSLIEPQEISFQPGQYMILLVPQKEAQIKRLYSIASSTNIKDSFELIVKIVEGGTASTYLKNLNVGGEVRFQGPAGIFKLKATPKDKVFLATGTGFAPSRSMILSSINNQTPKVNYHLFWGLRTVKDVFMLDELKQFKASNPNFSFQICLSREQNIESIKEEDRQYFILGRANVGCSKLLSQCSSINNYEYYICGGREVVDGLRVYLQELGVASENIIFEKF